MAMEQEIQVSVVLLTYEPKWEKLEPTIRSILCQQEVQMEVIVGDDGSKNDLFDRVEPMLSGVAHRLHKCPQNVGTLRNVLEALYCAKGEYVYLISPGDLLYDGLTLRDFYCFAKSQNAPILFGRGVYYNYDGDSTTVYRGIPQLPVHPELYTPGASPAARKLSFFLSSHILGAAFLRKREVAIRYMEQALPYAKYVEDATSTANALLDGVEVRFFDRNVVWYEYGTGLSAPDSKWGRIVADEITACVADLQERYPSDGVLALTAVRRSGMDKKKQLLWMLTHHPYLAALELHNRRRKIAVVACSQEEEARLRAFLSQE